MHRSGTSVLAGTLRDFGVFFGRVLDRGFALNPKGLQEAPSLLYMHEDLLEKSGGSWHEPPERVEWLSLHKSVRDLFIESRAGHPLWGFKDPRTLLTLEGWLDVLPDMRLVGVFRHPAEVAASIQRRNGFPAGKCFRIWEAYNQRLLLLHHERNFPLVEFVGDAERMDIALRGIGEWIGPGAAVSEPFYDRNLGHHTTTCLEAPASALRLLEELRERMS